MPPLQVKTLPRSTFYEKTSPHPGARALVQRGNAPRSESKSVREALRKVGRREVQKLRAFISPWLFKPSLSQMQVEILHAGARFGSPRKLGCLQAVYTGQ